MAVVLWNTSSVSSVIFDYINGSSSIYSWRSWNFIGVICLSLIGSSSSKSSAGSLSTASLKLPQAIYFSNSARASFCLWSSMFCVRNFSINSFCFCSASLAAFSSLAWSSRSFFILSCSSFSYWAFNLSYLFFSSIALMRSCSSLSFWLFIFWMFASHLRRCSSANYSIKFTILK